MRAVFVLLSFFILGSIADDQGLPERAPCACPTVRCSDSHELTLVPGTEHNCCRGDYSCSPVCGERLERCTLHLQGSGVNCALNSCVASAREEKVEEEPSGLMGGTQDLHGCVSGAGFQWCEAKQKCHRQWEEECPTEEEVQEEEEPRMGATQDLHGCMTGAGFQWCEAKQKCHRHWEEECPEEEEVEEEEKPRMGGTQDLHGCVSGAGFQWCEAKQKCHRQWEEECPTEEEAKEAVLSSPVGTESLSTEEAASTANTGLSSLSVGLMLVGLGMLAVLVGVLVVVAFRRRRQHSKHYLFQDEEDVAVLDI